MQVCDKHLELRTGSGMKSSAKSILKKDNSKYFDSFKINMQANCLHSQMLNNHPYVAGIKHHQDDLFHVE